MKTVIAAAFLIAASTTASATPTLNAYGGINQFVSGKTSTISFEAANRKGSQRVGGTGRSGKGSRYVGGRK